MAQKRITKFDPIPTSSNKTRVAAYCRISTLHEEQLSSIENQEEHYKTLIANHPDWINAGIYVDEGITGTKKEIRPELNRMLMDCRAGKIDLILTKSISRFARNTADCLQMVRSLSRRGVDIIFEKENVDTRRMDGEFLLTILSSLAEEESHSISDNEKWTVQKQYEDGSFKVKQAPYGYHWDNGKFVIDPEESEILKWMFDRVLEGKGTSWIADKLNDDGVPSRRNRKWNGSVVNRILSNVACIGDQVLCKTYKDKNFKTIRNYGELPQYYVDDHHEAIIDRDTFERAQIAIAQRGKEVGNVKQDPAERIKHNNKHTNHYPLTGKVVCGDCGSAMRRKTDYNKSGPRIYYECLTHRSNKDACPMKQVLQENIENAFTTMLNKLCYAPVLLDWYCENSVHEKTKKNRQRLQEISETLAVNAEKQHRFTLLLTSGCGEPILYQREIVKLQTEADKLKDERVKLTEPSDDPAVQFKRFVNDWKKTKQPVTEEQIGTWVNRIIVHSNTCFTFELKCGLKLTEGAMPSMEDKQKESEES